MYYAVVMVHAVATSKNISIFIDIPLKAAGQYFELYQVHSLHFSHKGIGKFVLIDKVFTYLAVAESGQFFAMMKPYMLLQCTQDSFTVCPFDMVLRTAGKKNCLIALFLGKRETVLKKCKQLMLNELIEPTRIGHLNLVIGYVVLVFLSRSQCSVKR